MNAKNDPISAAVEFAEIATAEEAWFEEWSRKDQPLDPRPPADPDSAWVYEDGLAGARRAVDVFLRERAPHDVRLTRAQQEAMCGRLSELYAEPSDVTVCLLCAARFLPPHDLMEARFHVIETGHNAFYHPPATVPGAFTLCPNCGVDPIADADYGICTVCLELSDPRTVWRSW